MFHNKFNTKNRKAQEVAELEAAYWDWKELSSEYEAIHSGLTLEALEWLMIDPHDGATRRYINRIADKLDALEAEWAALETKIMFAREIGQLLEVL